MNAQATVVWITGLPAAGKTTLALRLRDELRARGIRASCVDGDDLRATVSRDLGFGRDGRRENVARAAAIALERAERGESVVVGLVSPFAEDRACARATIAAAGIRFVEIFLDTPLAICRDRDPKGLYAAAATGELTGLTGWDAPYEAPSAPDLRIGAGADGDVPSLARAVAQVMGLLGHPS